MENSVPFSFFFFLMTNVIDGPFIIKCIFDISHISGCQVFEAQKRPFFSM
jgi:hypothetical protein